MAINVQESVKVFIRSMELALKLLKDAIGYPNADALAKMAESHKEVAKRTQPCVIIDGKEYTLSYPLVQGYFLGTDHLANTQRVALRRKRKYDIGSTSDKGSRYVGLISYASTDDNGAKSLDRLATKLNAIHGLNDKIVKVGCFEKYHLTCKISEHAYSIVILPSSSLRMDGLKDHLLQEAAHRSATSFEALLKSMPDSLVYHRYTAGKRTTPSILQTIEYSMLKDILV